MLCKREDFWPSAIYDNPSRTETAQIGGVTLQIVRDWVLKFKAHESEGSRRPRAAWPAPKA
jgi:hypothetical protein